MVTHLFVGKAWPTEKPSGPRAYDAFCRSPKGLHLTYHCGKLVSAELGQGLPTCWARFPPPAHESQLLLGGQGCLHHAEAVCSCFDILAKAGSQGTGL